MRKRFTNPYLMFNQPDGDGGGGKPTNEPKDTEGAKNDLGFPADTAVKDMTPDQQAAYWKHQARKHESRVKAYGDITPEQVQGLVDERENERKKKLSDADRQREEAVQKATTSAKADAARREADTALKIALRGRVIDGQAAFDRPDFVKDDAADVDAILEWVEQNSHPAQAGGGSGNQIPGQGDRERMKTSGRAAGQAEASKRFGKNS
ncbi:hypothetical protein [Glutamicibacter sp. X7]